MTEVFSPFAQTVYEQKYAMKDGDHVERWIDTADRVATHVFDAVDAPYDLYKSAFNLINDRVFMAGGRYLYASGRPFHQTQNCLLLRAQDSRHGWADLMQKVTSALMTGAGIGVVYSDIRGKGTSVRKTGGTSTGPLALMQMVNEAGRGIMQGGSRRSAIWAGLHWNHPDVFEFIQLKNWSPEVRELKAKDYNFPATMDGTNISVILDTEFFKAYGDSNHRDHSLAHNVYWAVCRQMLKTAEPGFSIDCGANEGENLRNAPVCGGTKVLTQQGYRRVDSMLGIPSTVWTGKQWAEGVVFSRTMENAPIVNVKMTGGRSIRCEPGHEFLVERYTGAGERRRLESIDRVKAGDLEEGDVLHVSLPSPDTSGYDKTAYTLGFLYGDGTFTQQGGAEVTLCTPEKKDCLTAFDHDFISSITKVDIRGYTRAYFKPNPMFAFRNHWTFPSEVYECSAGQVASFIAGLFDADGNVDYTQNRIRLSCNHEEFLHGVRRVLEQIGILASVSKNGSSTYGKKQTYQLCVMSDFIRDFAAKIPCKRLALNKLLEYESYRNSSIKIVSVEPDGQEDVYCADVKLDEHSFMAEGVIISNCTEVTSFDSNDICNLGSINMARVNSLDDMRHAVDVGTAFLLAGSVYSDVPYPEVDQVRTKNRRLGLGLMGLHEWLLKRGKPYGPDAELEEYLKVYAKSTSVARRLAKEWGLTAPVKTRAIAPTGTIGIIAETTTGIEPIFCVAYKRRYLKGDVVNYQYVVDPTAKRLIDSGVRPELIEDAYSLAENVERRVEFQAWVQQYVDHAISSTINLPAWGSELNNDETVRPFGEMLMKHLPNLRGVTVYPDAARSGQPLTAVPYQEAAAALGQVFVEAADVCDISKGGSCGA